MRRSSHNRFSYITLHSIQVLLIPKLRPEPKRYLPVVSQLVNQLVEFPNRQYSIPVSSPVLATVAFTRNTGDRIAAAICLRPWKTAQNSSGRELLR